METTNHGNVRAQMNSITNSGRKINTSYLQDVEHHTRNHAGFKQFHNFKRHGYIEKKGEERGHAAEGFQGLLLSFCGTASLQRYQSSINVNLEDT